VLIHGAGPDSWYWHLVVPELEARGHDVVAPHLPCDDDGAGLSDYADVVVDAIGAVATSSSATRSAPPRPRRRRCRRASCCVAMIVSSPPRSCVASCVIGLASRPTRWRAATSPCCTIRTSWSTASRPIARARPSREPAVAVSNG